jgi:hypothetical protein
VVISVSLRSYGNKPSRTDQKLTSEYRSPLPESGTMHLRFTEVLRRALGALPVCCVRVSVMCARSEGALELQTGTKQGVTTTGLRAYYRLCACVVRGVGAAREI